MGDSKSREYVTRHARVNGVDAKAAWAAARELAPGLPEQPGNEQDLKDATVALARRVAELEEEWS